MTEDETVAMVCAATAYITNTNTVLDEVVAARREAITELRLTMSQREVAAAVGLSHSRIAQIEQSGTRVNTYGPAMSRADAATVSHAILRTPRGGAT